MARNEPEFRVRVPEDVDAWLRASAEANGRTLTSEVAFRLKQARAAEQVESRAAGQSNQA